MDSDSQQRHSTLREDVENDLDEIISLRNNSDAKTAALKRLELLVGSLCVKSTTTADVVGDLDQLVRLQDSFEYNIPSRLLPWISASSARLESLYKSAGDDTDYDGSREIATQIALALSIVQGIALNHSRSKSWLGRIKSLEIFVDLLLTSRHVSSTATSSSLDPLNPGSLTSTILDTLLCILVDSTSALRAFEECNGVQAIVKILKRAVTPREVRMKCMEFLYFYLLDETKPSSSMISTESLQYDSPAPTVPNTPVHAKSHSRSRSSQSQSSILPPIVPNTPAKSSSSHSIMRGSSLSSISSDSSASSISQPSTTSRAKAKKPYLNGLTAPNRPSPKPRSEYGSSTYSFPHSSFSGPSVGSANSSEKGYVTESSQGSRSNSHNDPNVEDAVTATTTTTAANANAKSLRSVSSGSAQSFSSTTTTSSSTTSATTSSSLGSTTTAPSSAESSPKKMAVGLPPQVPVSVLPTIPSGSMVYGDYKTPPGSPEMEFVGKGKEPMTPSAKPKRNSAAAAPVVSRAVPKTPVSSKTSSSSNLSKVPPLPQSEKSSRPLFASASSSNGAMVQPRSLMMLKREVDFIPESPQKVFTGASGNTSAAPSPIGNGSGSGSGAFIYTGTVAGMGGRRGERARTHSRTRSALALGASSSTSSSSSSYSSMRTTTMSRGTSRERGHVRAKSVGRSEREERGVRNEDVDGGGEMMMKEQDEGRQAREILGLGMGQTEGKALSNGGVGVGSGGRKMVVRARTTEEKKEILGTMLGNVDALVEGVRNVGIWGLV
ncbi:hypothetical protein GYMLUDRAFT_265129 [Collybiopsis luxurians FD-317 M1]|uniref:Cell division control protein 14 n=1 Tax=Collybiopsis luxurians FD-317 M1 TaxID=944289 RepID=A0A0D0C612_9AGAR|nr:hypothetical protein GYMLUDRAFT_265129 [Collybiopsis luxurians FD-317 M1]